MKNCVILTMDNLEDFECYDSLLKEPMKNIGWNTHEISWRAENIDWDQYDAVIIRSPWDYQEDADAFMKVLTDIEQSKAILLNGIDLVKWNINKKYLAELHEKGVPIVPTIWKNNYDSSLIEQVKKQFFPVNDQQFIIKPCVSAGASDTFRLNYDEGTIDHKMLTSLFKDREFMVQPFIPAIVNEGEYSLFYFNGEYSHAILKKPKENDFRVQEEFGGHLSLIKPEESLLNAANKVLKEIPYETLYARVDFVRLGSNNSTSKNKEQQFALMEAELIEPSLYFNMDDQSAARFALAFDQHYLDLTK